MPKRKNKVNLNHPKKVQKFAHEQQFQSVEYYFEKGLRKIKPYVYKFECHAKGRWFGSKLLDVFKKEFRLESPEYYETAIREGLIRVNKSRASPDRILKNNDFMQSKVHRHEPPVSGEPIQIIAETPDYLVINKPSSIPVHPCGKYRHNTIVFILGKEYGFKGLHTIHRLDRLTSGLLLFARTLEVSHRLDAYVRDRMLEKTYICKVQGEFPGTPVVCEEPIFIVSHKIGVCRVKEDGKPCKTSFERLSYDGQTSIVKCYPHTGRMHQIRVHLQYLGYPIVNDPLYNNTVWGKEKGKGGYKGLSDEQLMKDLITQHDFEIDGALEKARLQAHMNKPPSPSQSNLAKPLDEASPPHVSEQNTSIESISSATTDNLSITETSALVDIEVGSTVDVIGSRTKGSDSATTVDSGGIVLSRTDNSEISLELEKKTAVIGSSSNPSSIQVNDINCPPGIKKTSADHTVEVNMDRTCHKDGKDNIDSKHTSGLSVNQENILSQNGQPLLTEARTSNESCSSISPDHMGNLRETKVADEGGMLNTIDGGKTDEKKKSNDKSTNGAMNTKESNEDICTKGANNDDERLIDEQTDKLAVALCRECREPMPDPEPEDMCIYLHALSYKGPDFEFSTPMPKWATEHFERTGTKVVT